MEKAKTARRDFAAEYDEQLPMAKKDIYKLPEGTWIELRWRDSPNDVLLLERRVEPMAGDCYVDTLCVVDGRLVKHRGVMHDQIVATHGRINVIAPPPSRS